MREREREGGRIGFFFPFKNISKVKFGTIIIGTIGEKVRRVRRKVRREKDGVVGAGRREGMGWHLNEERWKEYKGHLVKFEVVQAL